MDRAIRGPGSESCLLERNRKNANCYKCCNGHDGSEDTAFGNSKCHGASRDSGFGGGHGIVVSHIGG